MHAASGARTVAAAASPLPAAACCRHATAAHPACQSRPRVTQPHPPERIASDPGAGTAATAAGPLRRASLRPRLGLGHAGRAGDHRWSPGDGGFPFPGCNSTDAVAAAPACLAVRAAPAIGIVHACGTALAAPAAPAAAAAGPDDPAAPALARVRMVAVASGRPLPGRSRGLADAVRAPHRVADRRAVEPGVLLAKRDSGVRILCTTRPLATAGSGSAPGVIRAVARCRPAAGEPGCRLSHTRSTLAGCQPQACIRRPVAALPVGMECWR